MQLNGKKEEGAWNDASANSMNNNQQTTASQDLLVDAEKPELFIKRRSTDGLAEPYVILKLTPDSIYHIPVAPGK
jgi:hypothetical protein